MTSEDGVPFTGSHPAAVLPLLSHRLTGDRLLGTALVIGSMSPDLLYYVPRAIRPAIHTHTLAAALGTDVALGAALWLLWHGLLAAPMIDGAPTWIRSAVQWRPAAPRLRSARENVTFAVLAYVSLAIGSLTHVVWDSFTHVDRWGAAHIGFLRHDWGPFGGYRWAQYASSVIGAALVIQAVLRWWRRTHPLPSGSVVFTDRQRRAAWTSIAVLGLLAAVAETVPVLVADHEPPFNRAGFAAATGAGGGAFAALTCWSIYWTVIVHRGQRTPG